jgi:hypothetical protein
MYKDNSISRYKTLVDRDAIISKIQRRSEQRPCIVQAVASLYQLMFCSGFVLYMSERVKFKDFSRTFKAMYQQIQGLNTEEKGIEIRYEHAK